MLETGPGWQLPILEASALCVAPGGEGEAPRLLSVDDEAYEVAPAEIEGDDLRPAAARSVQSVVPGASNRSSEFEGVATDGEGRVFVLQEGADRILVFDAALETLERTITLSVPVDQPGLGAEWHDDANSRGEGLLLLDNGHLLVGKQRDEPRLIEFGPAGSEPQGYSPGDALAAGTPFPFGGEGDLGLEVLASWLVDPGSGLKSVNDLACDDEGRLHLISSKSRSIARIDGALVPEEETARFIPWELPGDLFAMEDDKAEGLVFAPPLGWLVALDLEREAPNVFRLTGVPR